MAAVSVLPDTCAWIDFFRGAQTPLATAVEQALLNGSVVTCGMVLYELTQGIRSVKEEKAVLSAFNAVPFLELSRRLWIDAGRLSADLRSRGTTLPMSDILIAVLAISNNAAVLTVDPHFVRISGVVVQEK